MRDKDTSTLREIKNGQTWQACQRSKVVQKGPKGTKMANLSVFDHLGPFAQTSDGIYEKVCLYVSEIVSGR